MDDHRAPASPAGIAAGAAGAQETVASLLPLEMPGAPAGHGGDGRDERALLSWEELAILQLVAEGLPLNSVAQHTAMSSRTVRRRLRGLCDRLGVTHPIQAIVWAARRGLI